MKIQLELSKAEVVDMIEEKYAQVILAMGYDPHSMEFDIEIDRYSFPYCKVTLSQKDAK